MDKEKQIEEIEQYIRGTDFCKRLPREICNKRSCSLCEAEIIYEAGYRKQKEGEWETVPEHRLDTLSTYRHRCIECDYFYKDTKPYGHNFCPKCGAKMKGGAE